MLVYQGVNYQRVSHCIVTPGIWFFTKEQFHHLFTLQFVLQEEPGELTHWHTASWMSWLRNHGRCLNKQPIIYKDETHRKTWPNSAHSCLTVKMFDVVGLGLSNWKQLFWVRNKQVKKSDPCELEWSITPEMTKCCGKFFGLWPRH